MQAIGYFEIIWRLTILGGDLFLAKWTGTIRKNQPKDSPQKATSPYLFAFGLFSVALQTLCAKVSRYISFAPVVLQRGETRNVPMPSAQPFRLESKKSLLVERVIG